MSAKFCPKCGTELKEGAKFCPKCGFDVNSSSSDAKTSDKTNESIEQAKQYSSNYINWLVNTIKNHTDVVETNKYFGITSYVIAAIITYFLSSSIVSHFSGLYDSSYQYEIRFAVAFAGFDVVKILDNPGLFKIMSVVAVIAFVGLGFLFNKLANGKNGNKESLFDYTNKLATYTNYAVVFEILILAFSLITQDPTIQITFILVGILLVTYFIGLSYSIVDSKKGTKLPKLYWVVLCVFVLVIVSFILFSGFVITSTGIQVNN